MRRLLCMQLPFPAQAFKISLLFPVCCVFVVILLTAALPKKIIQLRDIKPPIKQLPANLIQKKPESMNLSGLHKLNQIIILIQFHHY